MRRLVLAVVLALSAHARLAAACDDDTVDMDDDDDEDVAADPADNVRVDVMDLHGASESDAVDDDDSNWDGNDGCS